MSQPPFININDAGVAFLAAPLKAPPPGSSNKTTRPVNVAVHHDLTIELHGAQFSVSTTLSLDQAVALIGMLSYVVREKLYLQEATK